MREEPAAASLGEGRGIKLPQTFQKPPKPLPKHPQLLGELGSCGYMIWERPWEEGDGGARAGSGARGQNPHSASALMWLNPQPP